MSVMRRFVRIGTALALGASAVAVSQGQTPVPAACPSGAVSVYFASGETTASPEAEQLLGRIRETATTCQPDRIDLVAHIDAEAEGGRSLALSLERLRLIAGELVQAGLPADRIHVGGRVSEPRSALSSLHQIDVVFRKAEPSAPASAPAIAPSGRTLAAHLNEI